MSDHDMIQRGDALVLCERYPYVEGVKDAIRALPAVTPAVKVKPLKWKDSNGKFSEGSYTSHAIAFGRTYFVSASLDDPNWEAEVARKKAAAQADYEARILSVLVTEARHD